MISIFGLDQALIYWGLMIIIILLFAIAAKLHEDS